MLRAVLLSLPMDVIFLLLPRHALFFIMGWAPSCLLSDGAALARTPLGPSQAVPMPTAIPLSLLARRRPNINLAPFFAKQGGTITHIRIIRGGRTRRTDGGRADVPSFAPLSHFDNDLS